MLSAHPFQLKRILRTRKNFVRTNVHGTPAGAGGHSRLTAAELQSLIEKMGALRSGMKGFATSAHLSEAKAQRREIQTAEWL